jgi:hypothetical protein
MVKRLLSALSLILCVSVFFLFPLAHASESPGLKEIKYASDVTYHVLEVTSYCREKSAKGSYGKPLCQSVPDNSHYQVTLGKKDELYMQWAFSLKDEYEKPVKLKIYYTIFEHRGAAWIEIDTATRTFLCETGCQVAGSCHSKPLKLKERTEYRVAVRYVMDDDEAYRVSPIITIEPTGAK